MDEETIAHRVWAGYVVLEPGSNKVDHLLFTSKAAAMTHVIDTITGQLGGDLQPQDFEQQNDHVWKVRYDSQTKGVVLHTPVYEYHPDLEDERDV